VKKSAVPDQVQGFYFGKSVPAAEVGSNVMDEERKIIAAANKPRPIKASA
jgi:hypothetical protein